MVGRHHQTIPDHKAAGESVGASDRHAAFDRRCARVLAGYRERKEAGEAAAAKGAARDA